MRTLRNKSSNVEFQRGQSFCTIRCPHRNEVKFVIMREVESRSEMTDVKLSEANFGVHERLRQCVRNSDMQIFEEDFGIRWCEFVKFEVFDQQGRKSL